MVRSMENTFILVGIIIILVLIIIFLISNKHNNKNISFIINSKNLKKQNLEQNHEELLKNLNIQNLTGPIKTSKVTTQTTTKKVIYRNGEKISEETSNTENQIHSEAFTNCPNCGAKIEDSNITNCSYCNTSLTTMKIITKKDN